MIRPLKEYRGDNFMAPLYLALTNLDALRTEVYSQIIEHGFLKTSAHRDFQYVEQFLNRAIRYARLAKEAVDKVTMVD